MKKKMMVLKEICRIFNEEQIVYNIGASCMLYLRGIVVEFHDIDVMVSLEDVHTVEQIMDTLGKRVPAHRTNQYKTTYFYEYVVQDIDVDIMAGFSIVNKGKEHYFPLTKEEPIDMMTLEGIQLPLATVETWYKFYKLMERTDKVRVIENYKKHKGEKDET